MACNTSSMYNCVFPSLLGPSFADDDSNLSFKSSKSFAVTLLPCNGLGEKPLGNVCSSKCLTFDLLLVTFNSGGITNSGLSTRSGSIGLGSFDLTALGLGFGLASLIFLALTRFNN